MHHPPGDAGHTFLGGGGVLCWVFVAVRELSLAVVRGPLMAVVALVPEHKLQRARSFRSCSSRALEHRLHSRGAWA